MSYATIEKEGIVHMVSKDEYEKLVKTLDRKSLVSLVLHLSQHIGELKGRIEGPRAASAD